MPDPAALREFLAWGARQRDFPYSQVSYWAEAFVRKDGLDMYGRKIAPASPQPPRPEGTGDDA